MSTPEDPRPASEWVVPPVQTSEPQEPHNRSRGVAVGAASLVAAFAVGAGVVYGIQHLSGGNADASSNRPTASATQQGAGGFFGGGAQYVQGTITATTSRSVTVRSSSRTATYSVAASSEIVRNGQAAMLSAVKPGDTVFLHVSPGSSGAMVVDRLFAGMSAGSGGFGPPSGGEDDSGAGPTT